MAASLEATDWRVLREREKELEKMISRRRFLSELVIGAGPRKFVELHGGRIWVASEVGKGSTFTFMLPVRPWPTS